MSKQRKLSALTVNTIYSPDDSGYYCEVFDPQTGAELYSTRVFSTAHEALMAAHSLDSYKIPPGANDRWRNKA